MIQGRSILRALMVALPLAVACAFAPADARADSASSADLAEARALAIEGLRLASAHKCEEAIDRLTRAERIHHAPTTLGQLAECQIELGRVIAGTENLERLLHEPLPPKAPPAFVFARIRAERALASARAKIARITVLVEPGAARISIDGEATDVGVGRAMDPGEHVVAATAAGFVRTETSVKLQPGESREVRLALVPESEPNAPPGPVQPPPVTPPPVAPLPATPHASAAGTWTAFGVGALGIGAGAVLGAMYLSKRSDFDAQCPNGVCAAGANVTEEGVTTYRAAAAGSLVLGVTAVAVGIVLLATGGGPALSNTASGVPSVRF